MPETSRPRDADIYEIIIKIINASKYLNLKLLLSALNTKKEQKLKANIPRVLGCIKPNEYLKVPVCETRTALFSGGKIPIKNINNTITKVNPMTINETFAK